MSGWTRRKILAALGVLSAALAVFHGRSTAANTGDAILFRWEVPEIHKKAVEESLTYQGTLEVDDSKAIAVWVFAGLVLLPYLAQSILKLVHQMEKGGVVVDARSRPVQVTTDKSLPKGWIMVIQPDSKVVFERDEIESPADLVNIILKGKK